MCCGDAAQHTMLVAALEWAFGLSDAEMEAEVAGVLIDEMAGCWMDSVPEVHTAAQKTQGEQPDDSASPFTYPSLAAKGSFTLASLQMQEVLHFQAAEAAEAAEAEQAPLLRLLGLRRCTLCLQKLTRTWNSGRADVLGAGGVSLGDGQA